MYYKMYKIKNLRKFLIIAMILTMFLSPQVRDYAMSSNTEITQPNSFSNYDSLFHFLQQSGFDLAEVQQLFQDPRVEYYDDIAVSPTSPPKMDNYSSVFFHRESESYEIEGFIKQYSEQLTEAENRFGVDKEAITAVLFVETKLGKIVGSHSVFNILSSMATADSPESFTKIENYINEHYHYLDYDKRQYLIGLYKKRARRKAISARTEFAGLLQLHYDSHLDILELPGSYAGAFGYPQFMPSNVLRYGIDGDKDGRIDLYNYTDAIMSVGNFLSRKGWTEDTARQQRALLRYNNSNEYVADVLETASLIRKDFTLE